MKHTRIILLALAVAFAVGMMTSRWKEGTPGDPVGSKFQPAAKAVPASTLSKDVVSLAFDAYRAGKPPETSRKSCSNCGNHS